MGYQVHGKNHDNVTHIEIQFHVEVVTLGCV